MRDGETFGTRSRDGDDDDVSGVVVECVVSVVCFGVGYVVYV